MALLNTGVPVQIRTGPLVVHCFEAGNRQPHRRKGGGVWRSCLTPGNMPPCSCMRRRRHHPVAEPGLLSIAPGGFIPFPRGHLPHGGSRKQGGGCFDMEAPKISKKAAVIQGRWVLCPLTYAKIGAIETGATGKGVAPYCRKCGCAHPVRLEP